MDRILLKEMVDSGYVNVQKHPTQDLYIYNYSKSAQYEQIWNSVTLQCRGLIMDGEGNILSRPFKKFFNWEEHDPKEIPKGHFIAYEKVDGCLGILYWDNVGDPWISTRGSFSSDQSKAANKILRGNKELFLHAKNNFDRSKTYCFEIIHPSYRIVIDYAGKKDLVLLGVIDTQTGEDLPFPDHPFTQVKTFDGITDFQELKSLNRNNEEGFVLRFDCGFRMKIKFEEYCRLHSILTNVSTKSIWKCLRNDDDLDEILENVPDEFYDWVDGKRNELIEKFENIEAEVHAELQEVLIEFFPDKASDELREGEGRKDLAMKINDQCAYTGLAFAIFDKKDYGDKIWKMIEPDFETPFIKNEEG